MISKPNKKLGIVRRTIIMIKSVRIEERKKSNFFNAFEQTQYRVEKVKQRDQLVQK